jgi:hypothetical protein
VIAYETQPVGRIGCLLCLACCAAGFIGLAVGLIVGVMGTVGKTL